LTVPDSTRPIRRTRSRFRSAAIEDTLAPRPVRELRSVRAPTYAISYPAVAKSRLGSPAAPGRTRRRLSRPRSRRGRRDRRRTARGGRGRPRRAGWGRGRVGRVARQPTRHQCGTAVVRVVAGHVGYFDAPTAGEAYSNRYSNPVKFGGVRGCSPMCSKTA